MNNSISLDNILSKITFLKVFYDFNVSFKKTIQAINILKLKSNNYKIWMDLSKFYSGKSFFIINNSLTKFRKNINNYFLENFIKLLKKKYHFNKDSLDSSIKKIKKDIKENKSSIIISNMFVNNSNMYRKIFRRRGRGNFSYNKKPFINLYFELKYKYHDKAN